MRTRWKMLQDASRIRHRFVGSAGYGVAYGSHPSGTATATSDLDLILVSPQQPAPDQLNRLVDAVLRLHHDHDLALDTEVDYAVKVHATCADATAAVSLHCFDTTNDGHLKVAPLVVEPAFLNSDPFRLRLLLNALTSPRTFLGGDASLYEEHRRRAERALALLALALHDKPVITLPTAVRAVTEGPDGARGKDFLGYNPGPHLFSVLHCGLAHLALEGIVRDLDGTRFHHDPAARRAAIAQLRPQNAAERDPARGPGTMVLERRRGGSVSNHEVQPLLGQVATAVSEAINRARPELAGADPVVRRSEHADFQSNAALALAKRVGAKPRDLATDVVSTLDDGAIGSVELSGPGFLNITVPDQAVWHQVSARLASPRLGVGAPEEGRRTVVDYSAPNIAKEMHVGHLRTTIIGDSLARVLGFLGAEVIRQNHLGDWGTQFGMLIQYLDEHPDTTWRHDELSGNTSAVSALDELYKTARKEFDADHGFADRSRQRVVALQSGDSATLARWKEIVAESEKAFRDIYGRLGVLLTPEDSVGESFYNPMLADTIAELVDAGIAVDSEGALVIFSEEVTGPEGNPVPLMVRKSDGGYGYDTTDLATIRYRIHDLKANRMLYVTDSRQALHFRLIFEAARRAGWLTDNIDASHVPYGTVLGPDGRPFKTRAGGTVRLMDLLDDAVNRARAVVQEKDPDLDAAELDQIAEQAGIGAVKYADLSTSRVKDYTFDVDRMVSFTGNTGVYLQYAHTRIRSILRKAGDPEVTIDPSIPLEPAERALALELDAYAQTLTEVSTSLEPHRLCGYLYDLARDFTTFYEACHVLNTDEPIRSNRLALCQLTAHTLKHGLGLLGITAPERM